LLTGQKNLLPAKNNNDNAGLEKAKQFHSQESGKCYVKLRLQHYYNSYRYSMCESIVPYADRVSTRLQYCNNVRRNALFNPESTDECVGDVNISTLFKNLNKYNIALAENMRSFERKTGNRVETAFAVKIPISCHHNRSAADGSKQAFDANYIASLLKGPIHDVLTEAKRSTRIILLEDVVTYTTCISNAYTFLYEICLNKVQDALPPMQISCICIFLKYIQDFLGILYTGSTKPSTYKCEASNIMRKYNYSVFAKKLANGLNRPYCLLPTIPAIIREYLGAYSFGDKKYQEGKKMLLNNRGFILTQPLNSKESMERKRKFENLVTNGHEEGTGKLAVCANDKCQNRFHFSVNALHHHLIMNPSCKSSIKRTAAAISPDSENVDQAYQMEAMSPEIVAHMNTFIQSKCTAASPEHEKALKFVREGKSIYISGDGGAGKSYLARLLLRQLLMIHGDWKIHKSGRTKVFGVAFQGIACTNMGTSFTSIHKYLEIEDFNLISIGSDEDIREFCQERINNGPALRNKLRMTEALIIDEVGMIHDLLGRYLVMFLKVARANDLAFGGIQVIVCGQLTQGLPVQENSIDDAKYKQRSWGANDEVNNNTHHIHLNTLYRSGNDVNLQKLIKLAKHGELTEKDIRFIKDNSGKNVRNCLESTVLAKKQEVINLYYEVDQARASNVNFITSNACLRQLPEYQLKQVFARDYLPSDMENDNDIYSKVECAADDEGNTLGRRSFGGVSPDMYVYIGMPVVLTKNIWASDYTKECNLAKGAQGTITSFRYNETSGDIDEVFISFKLTTDEGYEFIYPMSTKRQLGYHHNVSNFYLRCASLTKRQMALRRKMFPFTYGKDLSWSSIQGLTLKKVVVDLKNNNIVTNPNRKFDVAGLFYIALSRVSSLDNFLLIWPGGQFHNVVQYHMKFMNYVDNFSVDFEKNWVMRAQQEHDEYVIKAQDSIALLDMKRESYFTKYSYHPEVQRANEKDNEIIDKDASKILYALWYYFMLSVHFEEEVDFMFETDKLQLYKIWFIATVNKAKKIKPTTEVYQQLKDLLLENISGFFPVSENKPTFERMTEQQYREEGGKDKIDILKKQVFEVCPLLKEYTATKSEEYLKTVKKTRHLLRTCNVTIQIT
jgi:DNA replication protein DnaC